MIIRYLLRTAGVLFLIITAPVLFAEGAPEEEAGVRAEATRTVTHALGTIEVPASVERVVTLEWSYTEDVLALGMQPVGVADIGGYEKWVDVPAALDGSVVDVGRRQEPNLERIAELRPDLIITSAGRSANNYDALNAIAPALVFNMYPEDGSSQYEAMLRAFRAVAEALNREEAGEAVLAELEVTLKTARRALERSGLAGDEFVLAQSYLSGDSPVFRLFTDNAMAVEIIERIGLVNAWEDAPGDYGFSTVDFEGLKGIAGGGDGVHFLYIAQPDAREAITGAPVWSALGFVRSGKAYWLGGDAWLFGGPLSAATLVEGISDALEGGRGAAWAMHKRHSVVSL